MLVANGVGAVAAVANVLVGSLATVVPSLGRGVPRALFLSLLFAAFTMLNIRGTKAGSRAVVTLTVLKLAPLLILLVAGLGSVQVANLAWTDPPTVGGLARGSLLLVFALTGMEIALTPTGEIENPARTVPIAALLGVAVTAALYLGIHLVAQGVLGADLATFSATPLAEVAEVARVRSSETGSARDFDSSLPCHRRRLDVLALATLLGSGGNQHQRRAPRTR